MRPRTTQGMVTKELEGAGSLTNQGRATPALDCIPVGFFYMNAFKPLFVRSLFKVKVIPD